VTAIRQNEILQIFEQIFYLFMSSVSDPNSRLTVECTNDD